MSCCIVIPVNLTGSSTNQEMNQFGFQQCFKKNAPNQKNKYTPETNMSPKKEPFEKEHSFPTIIWQGTLWKFRGCNKKWCLNVALSVEFDHPWLDAITVAPHHFFTKWKHERVDSVCSRLSFSFKRGGYKVKYPTKDGTLKAVWWSLLQRSSNKIA